MEVKSKMLEIDLSIDVVNDEVIATLVFVNASFGVIYLDSWTIGMHQLLTKSVFSIIDKNNNIIPYYGVMASRRIVFEDFIALNPGESIQTKIKINKDYILVKGNKYVVRYSAYNPACPGTQANLELRSNEVEMTY
ncbi:hypothetical protein [Niastella sp. OAS944]|uniref:hypothetical protein n=1 Tax=Niastella sp. OAS944 TaxID=2664089 RepID=UPI00349A3F59|nr:hypothetical protein [Chitinophagaceae bacterium OAS944]